MNPVKKPRKSRKIALISAALVTIVVTILIVLVVFKCQPAASPAKQVAKTDNKNASVAAPEAAKTTKVSEPVFNTALHSTIDPASLWVVVNKQHPLSVIDYVPSDLIATNGATISAKARADFEAMMTAATSQGVNLIASSSYRSYATQDSLYNNYVASSGQAAADTFSAKPGYSEHQTGLAIDFTGASNPNCNYDDCYATTAEGSWLATHAAEFGFLLRYTTEKQSITGYKNEPWHYRYIGRELAEQMKNQQISTLEEFFNISGGISY